MPRLLFGFCALLLSAGPALAEPLVRDAYARATLPGAKAGAIFLQIENSAETALHLVDVASDAAMRVELHAHIEDADGVMRMVHLEDGRRIAPGESLLLERGGDHVMLMGLKAPLVAGEYVEVTLMFEDGQELAVSVPVVADR